VSSTFYFKSCEFSVRLANIIAKELYKQLVTGACIAGACIAGACIAVQ